VGALELLRDAGADLTAADEEGKTPLDVALEKGHEAAAALLGRLQERFEAYEAETARVARLRAALEARAAEEARRAGDAPAAPVDARGLRAADPV
jgi:ankyrin repeat protein